jgi:O-antigen/teichoic acid export membrane protein
VCAGATGMLSQYFLGVGRPRLLLLLSAIQLLIQLGIAVLIIPAFGLAGAAMASSLTFIIVALLTAVSFSRATAVSLRSTLVATPSDVRDLIAFAISRARLLGVASIWPAAAQR